MPRDFSPATAEQVVIAVEAIVAFNRACTVTEVAAFADLPNPQAEKALRLAEDLGLIQNLGGANFTLSSPLARFFVTPHEAQRAAALRIVLEQYEPFLVFRERLRSTSLPPTAARQTKTVLDLTAHHDEVKDTLISLGTYSQAIVAQGGGNYGLSEAPAQHALEALASACSEKTAAEGRVRIQIGTKNATHLSPQEVIDPLADALVRAVAGDSKGAVVQAGNAVESFLANLATTTSTTISGANGINAKAQRLRDAGHLPLKLLNMSKYLGHLRNAADHGIDADVNASWDVSEETGVEYVFVACSVIRCCLEWNLNSKPVV